MNRLDELQAWYAAQCDGDWEHTFGLRITTLDNPGWSVEINLQDTLLMSKPFEPVEEGLDGDNPTWVRCWIEGQRFRGVGDPGRLGRILSIFLEWAKSEPDWLSLPRSDDRSSRDDRSNRLA